MPDYVIPPPPAVAVPVAGGGLFPVRRIFCVGRNYAEHAREMGHDPGAEPPFFFSKPADALVTAGAETPYPPATSDLHHEIELVVAIGRAGADIAVASARDHVWGYAACRSRRRRRPASPGTWPRASTIPPPSASSVRLLPAGIPPPAASPSPSTGSRASMATSPT
jgi:hypothetical protein